MKSERMEYRVGVSMDISQCQSTIQAIVKTRRAIEEGLGTECLNTGVGAGTSDMGWYLGTAVEALDFKIRLDDVVRKNWSWAFETYVSAHLTISDESGTKAIYSLGQFNIKGAQGA